MKAQNPFLIAFAFFAIYIIWGTTYLAVSFGLRGFPPFLLSAFRFLIAGVLLFIYCICKGEKLPVKKVITVCVISGCLMLIGGSGVVPWAEKYVSSGHAATMLAITPFLFILLDKKRWASYFQNKIILAGLVIGFSGLILFVRTAAPVANKSFDNSMFLTANIVLVLSAILWVVGSLYAKNKLISSDSNSMTASLQLLSGGIGSALIAGCKGEFKHFSFTGISLVAWGGLLYLIIFGSVVAYVAFRWLLAIRPPAIVSTHTYINPVVAVILGWLIASEKLSAWQIVALVIILTGMLLTNLPKYISSNKKTEPAFS